MIAEQPVEVEIRRLRGVDKDAVPRRNDALLPVLLDAAHSLQLDEEEEVLAKIKADVAFVTTNNAHVGGDLNDFHAGGIAEYDATVYPLALVPAQRIKSSAGGLELVPPLL